MEYLVQFNNDLCGGRIKIRESYVTNQTNKKNTEFDDVVTDIIENDQSVSVACLPIAKQIVIFEKKMCLCVPKIGDLFVGIVHHPVIEKVTFTINNYLEEIIVDGQLEQINHLFLWKITHLPIIFLTIHDYDKINISVQIHINSSYNLQNANQDVFRACYGYFHQSIKQQLMKHMVYEIPLLNQTHCLKIICGIWSIFEQASDKRSSPKCTI